MKPFKLKTKAMLPSRQAVNMLTKGGAQAQTMGNYAKLTPSGSGALTSYQSIIDQGYPKPKRK